MATRLQLIFWICLLYINIETTINATSCGSNFINVRSGHVTSPNYPKPYPKNADCEWKIIASSIERIELKIEFIQNKENIRCYDYLDIFQEIKTPTSERNISISDDLCGKSVHDLPQTVFIIEPHPPYPTVAIIRFSSDYAIQLKGFSIAFEISSPLQSSITTQLSSATQRKNLSITTLLGSPLQSSITTQRSSNSSRATQSISSSTGLATHYSTTPLISFTAQKATKPTSTSIEFSHLMKKVKVAKSLKEQLSTYNTSILLIITIAACVTFTVFVGLLVAFLIKRHRSRRSSLLPTLGVTFQNTFGGDNEQTNMVRRSNTYFEIVHPNKGKPDLSCLVNGKMNTSRSSSSNSLNFITAAKRVIAEQADEKMNKEMSGNFEDIYESVDELYSSPRSNLLAPETSSSSENISQNQSAKVADSPYVDMEPQTN